MDRRTFVIGGSAALAAVLAGCTDETSEPDTTDENDSLDSDTTADEDTSNVSDVLDAIETVEPTVTDLRHPEARAVSTNDEDFTETQRQFSITVENTGTSGDIEMTLVFLDDLETSVWSPFVEEVATYKRYFSAGERRTETFTAEWDGSYGAYGFRLLPAEAEVDVRNDGAEGEADVRLVQSGGVGDGTVLESKTVELAEDTETTVPFSVDASFTLETDVADIQLDAEAHPAESTS